VQGLEKLAEQQSELITRQDVLDRDLQSLQAKLETIRAERITLDDEIEASQSVHTAKIKLDGLVERRKSIEAYRELKAEDRLDLLGLAWRDLVELKVSVRREQLEAQRQEL
jgi:predicted aspartyl protease